MKRGRGIALSMVGMLAALVAMPSLAMAKGVELDAYGAQAESYGVDVRVLPLSGFPVPVIQPGILPDIADEYFPHTFAKIDSLPHANADGEFFDPGGTVTQASFDLGAAWIPAAHPNFQLDGGVNLGLNNQTPAAQAYVGVSQRF